MKILIVCDGTVPSLHKSYRADPLAKFLSNKGHNITVLCAKPTKIQNYSISGYENVEFIYLPEYRQPKTIIDLAGRGYQFILMVKRLKDLLQKRNYDIIRPISLIPAYASILISRKLNIHTPILTNLVDFYSDLYKQFELPLASFMSRFLRNVEKTVAKGSNVALVDSPTGRRYWGYLGLDEKRCIVSPNGLYLERFKPRSGTIVKEKYGIREHEKVVFYHGDISRLDGLDILISAAPSIIKRNKNIKFMIVGSGLDKFLRELRIQIKKNGIEKHFIFTGWIPHVRIPEYIAVADVCVAPFRITITSDSADCLKVVEYVAMGKPVVTSKANGLKELFGQLLHYVDPGNPAILADAILEELETGGPSIDKLNKMLEKSRKFDWKEIVQQEEKVMLAMLSGEVKDYRSFDLFS